VTVSACHVCPPTLGSAYFSDFPSCRVVTWFYRQRRLFRTTVSFVGVSNLERRRRDTASLASTISREERKEEVSLPDLARSDFSRDPPPAPLYFLAPLPPSHVHHLLLLHYLLLLLLLLRFHRLPLLFCDKPPSVKHHANTGRAIGAFSCCYCRRLHRCRRRRRRRSAAARTLYGTLPRERIAILPRGTTLSTGLGRFRAFAPLPTGACVKGRCVCVCVRCPPAHTRTPYNAPTVVAVDVAVVVVVTNREYYHRVTREAVDRRETRSGARYAKEGRRPRSS